MTALPLVDIVGYWIGIFITFACLSFLYKDNPFYKLAEHLFIGVSVGYLIVLQYGDNVEPKVVDALFRGGAHGVWWVLRALALVLVVLMFVKVLSPRWGWLGRYPLAFVVAFYAGLQVNAVAQSELAEQIKFSAGSIDAPKVDLNSADDEALTALPGSSPLVAKKLLDERAQRPFASLDDAATRPSLTPLERADLAAARGSMIGLDAKAAVEPGHHDGFGIVSNLLLLAGLLSSLVYFYFSVAHRGPIGAISRFGVWVLMIGFGASFGLTVQGRISLAIGRAYDVLGRTVAPEDADRIHGPVVALVCIALIGGGIAVWEVRERRRDRDRDPGASGGS
ncbi:MAG: hypothetical protein IPL61_18305 [Myxococcales bacterium]|nr:hypothetical protein [Myxococcales bacterium]